MVFRGSGRGTVVTNWIQRRPTHNFTEQIYGRFWLDIQHKIIWMLLQSFMHGQVLRKLNKKKIKYKQKTASFLRKSSLVAMVWRKWVQIFYLCSEQGIALIHFPQTVQHLRQLRRIVRLHGDLNGWACVKLQRSVDIRLKSRESPKI